MSDLPVFDYRKLLTSTVEDEDLAREVVGAMVLETPIILQSLEAAVDGERAKDAEREAHSLKSVAATAGGERLREVAFKCERLAKDGKLKEVAALMPRLREEYEAFEQALRDRGLV